MELNDNKDLKILNKETEKEHTKPFVISFPRSRGRIQFSVSLNEECKLSSDKFVHFFIFGNSMYFCVNNDNKGYKLTLSHLRDNKEKFNITSAYICDIASKDFSVNKGDSFYVQKSKNEFKGLPLYEILLNKSISKIGK